MESYRDFLKSKLTERCRSNTRYSLRAFARDLGVSASVLSEVMSGKHGLSEQKAKKIAEKLNINEQEQATFLSQVLASDARSKVKRNAAIKTLLGEEERISHSPLQLTLDAFKVVSDWYYFAVLEYLQIRNVSLDPSDIAVALDLSIHVVKDALDRLEKLEMIERRKETYRVIEPIFVTPTGVPSDAIRNFHKRILEKAIEALSLQSIEQREFRNLVFAVNRKKLPELKSKIKKMMREINQESLIEPEKETVYNLSVQLFELSPRIKNRNQKKINK